MVSSTVSYQEIWIRLVTSRNSIIQVMLDQEDDPELYDDWLTSDEWLTHFIKTREKNVGKVKGAELPSFQGTQSYEEKLFFMGRVPSRTARPSVIEPGTDENHIPIFQAQNGGSSDNSQEIPVSIYNVSHDGTKYQPVTSPLGDVTYWSSVPSGHTFSIETGNSWILALELSFCA